MVYAAIQREARRQQDQLELIASENIVSPAVLEAQGSVLTNKYAEGYPSARYYGGCIYVDEIEELARERARLLFQADYVNVQPHSGSQANQAVFMALMKPGDTFLGMSLDAGGHLTHGAPPTLSGKWFKPIGYHVRAQDHLIDYDQVEALALEHKPKLIIAGGSSYPRIIDFARFRAIADQVGAYLMVDMAHFAGLVAGGVYPNPIPYADVVTTTTHKTLRGPRGGMILSRHAELGKKLNSAVFPGVQGGPLMHVIAAKAVCFGEALQPAFKEYAHNVVRNAQAFALHLAEQGFPIVSGGTDSHVFLVDLSTHHITGKDAEHSLEQAGMTCNKNAIPYDPLGPRVTSGIRIGTPTLTTRGMGADEMRIIGSWMAQILKGLGSHGIDHPEHQALEHTVREEVHHLCQRFPLTPL